MSVDVKPYRLIHKGVNIILSQFKFSYAKEELDVNYYVTFGIAPRGNPMARSGSGRFKLQVKDTGNSPTVFFMLADTSEANGHPLGTRHYEYKNTYDVRLETKGIFMNVYINNVDTKETISVPSGAKVLYIGYNLPLLAGVDVRITDLTIDGVKQ